MKRDNLLHTIKMYKTEFLPILSKHYSYNAQEELDILSRFEGFVAQHTDCFERSCHVGHITGSALVVNPKFNQVVLTHHKKLDKWLQLGGHADGCHFVEQVAMKEAQEESGITSLSFFKPSTINAQIETIIPFDFDIHFIPEHKNTPAHYHYDMRYVIIAHESELTISDESNDLRWFDLERAKSVNQERSMLRQFDKLQLLNAFI